MKRVFQKEIQNPLAVEILAGKLVAGSTVKIDYRGDAFQFSTI
jgi:ATP-dependent Clp protease ATP-binding subunit ClpA